MYVYIINKYKHNHVYVIACNTKINISAYNTHTVQYTQKGVDTVYARRLHNNHIHTVHI